MYSVTPVWQQVALYSVGYESLLWFLLFLQSFDSSFGGGYNESDKLTLNSIFVITKEFLIHLKNRLIALYQQCTYSFQWLVSVSLWFLDSITMVFTAMLT
jgi:hypothetical protein